MKLLITALVLLIGVSAAFIFLKRQAVSTILTPVPQKSPEKVIAIKDNVIVTRGNTAIPVMPDTPLDLQVGDKITTDANGVAIINYQEGTAARLGQNSAVTFNGTTNLFHEIGNVFVRFKKIIGIEESFSIETSNLVATVRGTAFTSIIEKGLDPKILVVEDTVEVLNKLDQTKEDVQSGDQIEFSLTTKKLKKPTKQILTQKLKDWLEFNRNADDLLTRRELPKITPSPSPVPTVKPSTTPKPSTGPSVAPAASIGKMPGAGYSTSTVVTDVGTYTLSCIGAAQGTFHLVTDSANDADCHDNCPVMALDQFATRNGGFAAMNGMYFCPADYPSCAGKSNTFDTLFFNSRNKTYINSANNVYSSLPFFVVNGDGSPRFIGQSSGWGRDTGIQGGTAGNPMLVQGGNIAVVEGNLDTKQKTAVANRGAIVQAGNMLYLCITRGATVQASAHVYKTLGADNAINIDGGGSSAMWINGKYVYGPGRAIPTAIIFAH